jgi:hypothetical protein
MLFVSDITVLAAAEVENWYPSDGGRQCCSMSDVFSNTSISYRETPYACFSSLSQF